jgi:mono/diheme cytochrome c family protein
VPASKGIADWFRVLRMRSHPVETASLGRKTGSKKDIQPASKASPSTRSVRTGKIAGGCVVAVLALGASGGALRAATTGDYTQSQASAGMQAFSQNCASCHGSNLMGQSGPPLAGANFASNLNYSKMSAQQLYDFIRTQMPVNAPGSLSEQQYLQIFAYILSKNGYPQGSTPLSAATLGSVQLLPVPGAAASNQSNGSPPSQANSQ